MVLVNSHPGKIYPALAHAGWNQWAFADLIFPFFVFIVGVAIPYSVANRLGRGISRQRLFWQILADACCCSRWASSSTVIRGSIFNASHHECAATDCHLLFSRLDHLCLPAA